MGFERRTLRPQHKFSLTAPRQAAGVASPQWAGNLSGGKAFSAEPPNALHMEDHARFPDRHPPGLDSPHSHIPGRVPRPTPPENSAPATPHHLPRRLRSSCPCRSCGFSGGSRPQGTPAGEATHCLGGHPPSPGLVMAPETGHKKRALLGLCHIWEG